MIQSLAFLKDSWEAQVERLVKAPAKKHGVIEGKQRQIIEGACKVFFEKGFHPTSIREIAEAAGMSRGQLYYYISSKDDILFLIHMHMQMSWHRYLKNAKIDEIKDPRQRLEFASKSTFDFLIENKELIQFIYTESKYLNKDHLKVVLDMDSKNVVQFWRELVIEALGDSAQNRAIDLAANLITYLMVFYPLRGWNFKEIPTDDISSFLIDFIFRGLGIKMPENRENKKA
ncbi:MAG: TetR/AcrR family transcriptional regulator [Deltaproteobacteria bacterium]|nr:TetR/AcrR family transcriptional regulator [Deltaproteobacteria bacterium]